MKQQSTTIEAWVIVAVVAAGIMSFAGVVVETAVNISFPTLMREFGVSTSLVQWMTTICLLTISLTVPLSAYLKRRFKTKHLFVFANLTFTCGLLIDIFAPNFGLLLLGRLVQGIGTGVALPLMFNIILDWVPQNRVGTMMGVGTMITGIAPAIGPTYGGLLVNSLGWRWIFIFLLPLLIFSLVMGLFTIRQQTSCTRPRFDWWGLVSLVLMFVGLTMGFANMGSQPFWSLLVAGSFILGLLGTGAFIRRSLAVSAPIINLRIFRNSSFARLALGFLLFQLVALGAITGPFGGRLLDQWGARRPVLAGSGLSWLAVIGLAFLAGGLLSNGLIVFLYACFMLGIGLSFGNIMTSALASLPDAENGDGNAILNTLQQFSGAVGTSVVSAIVAASQRNHQLSLAQTTATGTQHALVVLVVVLAAELVIVAVTLPRTQRA
ncbi:MFS transporter [Limosilactobacillus oris]|uniref:MFS transporter n=1 Tax=Limosilactobacillus oris TaxID=1632 RepID=UPI0022362FB4|nr:MFS transporter [Limosilactobacillus oris]MCW4387635.1 MFS transporter [Limosilactobacillus oris]